MFVVPVVYVCSGVMACDGVDHVIHIRMESVRAAEARVQLYSRHGAAWDVTSSEVWSFTQVIDHIVARGVVHSCGDMHQ